MKTVLVMAPHPDDEILGCGAVMARHIAEGDVVNVCIVSNHDAPLYTAEHRETTKSEARSAHAVLGIHETVFLDYPAVTLKELPAYTINQAISNVIQKIKPEVLYMPHVGDMHIDHRVIAEATLVAIRPLSHNTVKKAYAYETLSETEWNLPRSEYAFIPNVFVDVTSYIHKKLEAMACFQSQLYEQPHPRSLEAITTLAKMRGNTISVQYAEAFALVRELV